MNLYGLIGEKLGHTYSPVIHKSILDAINIKGRYDILEVSRGDIVNVVAKLKDKGYKGVNVTIPYKIEIMKYLDEVSEEAKAIGAINVISFSNGKAIGYNSDYYGFAMALGKSNIDCKGKTVVILGTGGASRAVVQYLINNSVANIIFVSSNVKNAKIKYPQFKVISYAQIRELVNKDLIINCTPVGMYPNSEATPIKKELLLGFEGAIDLIYNPKETVFLKDARSLGLKTSNGIYMLVAQAIKAQEIWNHCTISNEVLKSILKNI